MGSVLCSSLLSRTDINADTYQVTRIPMRGYRNVAPQYIDRQTIGKYKDGGTKSCQVALSLGVMSWYEARPKDVGRRRGAIRLGLRRCKLMFRSMRFPGMMKGSNLMHHLYILVNRQEWTQGNETGGNSPYQVASQSICRLQWIGR